MNEEMRAHVDALIERNVAAGMTVEEARFAALRSFGGVAQIAERARDERRSVWIEQVWQDVHYAARQLRKTPGFTAVVVLSLALGIGANTAIFSLLDEVLLKPLPVRAPHELVLFEWRADIRFNGLGGGPGTRDPISQVRIGRGFSRSSLDRMREQPQALVDLLAFRPLGIDVSVDGRRESAQAAQLVSGDYFSIIGVHASLGRTLDAADDQDGAPTVAVISHRYWWDRFGGDASVIGRTIRVNERSATIVGVTPPWFHGTLGRGRTNDIYLPLSLARELAASTSDSWDLQLMGRLSSGATATEVQAQFADVFRAAAIDAMQNHSQKALWLKTPGFARLRIQSGAQGFAQHDPQSLVTLQGLAGLLLLIACSNVANLLLARGAARQREIAVRLALGASRARLIRQLLTESGLIAFCGVAVGTLLAWWGKDLLLAMHPLSGFGSVFEPRIDGRVLAFTGATVAFTCVLCGLAPALRATRLELNAEFQGGTRTLGGGSRAALRLGRTLMVVQVALSLVLLIGAGLFARTLRNLQAADVGFNREQLLLFRIEPRGAGYPPAQSMSLYEHISAHLAELPGVRSVAFSDFAVLAGGNAYLGSVGVPGYQAPPGETPDGSATMRFVVGPDFFATYEMPILQGRDFSPRDDRAAPKVAVIDQTMARKYFGEGNPIGCHFTIGSQPDAPPIEIIGVVPDTKSINLRRWTPPTFYLLAAQRDSLASAHFAVRTIADPSAIAASLRNAVREIDRNLPLINLRTQDEQVEKLVMHEKFFARLSRFFSLLALVLVCIGLYGLMSYAVLRRTGEIGLRMALGALPRRVLWMVLCESLGLVGLGIVAGLGVASAASRLISSLLYGLSAIDSTTYGSVAVLLVLVALVACWLPARRAAKIDPMAALRAE